MPRSVVDAQGVPVEGPPETQGWLGQVGRSTSVLSVQTATHDMLGPLPAGNPPLQGSGKPGGNAFCHECEDLQGFWVFQPSAPCLAKASVLYRDDARLL